MAWIFWKYIRSNKNRSRWSDIVAVMLSGFTSWEIILENIVSIRVSEWLVILVGCNIYVIKEFEARESRNSFVG